MAKKIKLKDYLASLPVAENLKGFTGVDAANALGQMTPERLAAVAGGFLGSDLFLDNFPAKSKVVVKSSEPCLVLMRFTHEPTVVIFDYGKNKGTVVCQSSGVELFNEQSTIGLSIYRNTDNHLVFQNNLDIQLTCAARIIYPLKITPKTSIVKLV